MKLPLSLPSKASEGGRRFHSVVLGLALIASCVLAALALYWMQLTGKGFDETLQRTNAHHIELSYPYGLTKDDLESVRSLSGVQDLEGVYRCYETCRGKSGNACVRVSSISERIDTLELAEGKLPSEMNQIVLTRDTAQLLGVGIGDSLVFDVAKERDAAGIAADTPRFRCESFELVGLVEAPLTMREDDGSYGLAPAAWGSAQGCAWVQAKAFGDVATQEGYNSLLIQSTSSASGSYIPLLDGEDDAALVRDLEQLGSQRSAQRYASLCEEAQNRVNEKAQLLAEAKQVMETSVAALNTATTQITNAQSLITSTKALLPTYESKVASLEAELAKKNEALKKAQDEKKPAFDAAKTELDKLKAEYEAAVAKGESSETLAQIQKRLQTQQTRYDEAETTYKKALEEPQKQVDSTTTQLRYARATRDDAYAQIDQLNQEIEEADAVRTEETKGFSEDQKDIVQKVNMLEVEQRRQQALSERPWQITLAREQGLVGMAAQCRRMLLSALLLLVPALLVLCVLLFAIARSERRQQEGSTLQEGDVDKSEAEEQSVLPDEALASLPAPADEDAAAHRGLVSAGLLWGAAVLVASAVVFAGAQQMLGARASAQENFATIALVDPAVRNTDEKIAEVAEAEGMSTIPAVWESVSVTLGRGREAYAQLLATEPEHADELAGFAFSSGAVDLESDRPYLCRAYESYARANVGDDVLLLDGGGSPLHVRPEGYMASPMGVWSLVMGPAAYEKAFDVDYEPNAICLKGSPADTGKLRQTIEQIPGVLGTLALRHGEGRLSNTALEGLRWMSLIETLVAALLFVSLCLRAHMPQAGAGRTRALLCRIAVILGGALFGLLIGWHALDCAGMGGMRFALRSGAVAAMCGFVGALLVLAFVWRYAANGASARAEESEENASE